VEKVSEPQKRISKGFPVAEDEDDLLTRTSGERLESRGQHEPMTLVEWIFSGRSFDPPVARLNLVDMVRAGKGE
jgi:hypothetical protein